MRRSSCAWLIAAVSLAGCFAPPPRRPTDLSTISSTNTALRRMRVAVIYDENARAAMAYLRGVREKTSRFGPTFDDQAAIRPFNELLRKSFSDVVVVESPEQAGPAGANTIGVAGLYAKVGTIPLTMSETELSVDFRRLDMSAISVVRGAGRRRVPYPNFGPNWPSTAQDAVDAFGAALSTDAALSAYAASLAAPAPIAAVAAPGLPRTLAPSFASPPAEEDFAVVVGIERYPDLPAAAYAERDALAAKAFFRALGLPERNIALLTGSRATKTGMEKTLEAWLPNNVSARSRVYLYYSGHGAPDAQSGDAYLVPSDGDPQYLAQTGYPLKRLFAQLGRLKAKAVLVALDSCFSGAGGRSVLAKGTRPLVTKVDIAAEARGKVSVISASAGDQISGSNDEAGHGLFTYNFLQGLDGAAKDARGQVTLKSLYGYLKPRVQDGARRANRDQTPQLRASSEDLVLRLK